MSTSCLTPFSRHPYKVRDDDAMRDMAESVKQYGVLSPAIARPLPDGGYELVSGHRRQAAQILPALLHAEADGGDHHQAAGAVAETQKARGGALIEYIS